MAALKPKPDERLNLLDVRIESERLALLPVSRDVDEGILKEFTPVVTRYMIPKAVEDIHQVHEFINFSRDKMDAGDELVLAITRRSSGEFLGICGLHNKTHGDTPELGIWLKLDAHGARLGREAIHALVAWARGHLEFSYFIYPVDKHNIPSRRIAESLGGVVVRKRRRESMSGYMLNELVYRIDG